MIVSQSSNTTCHPNRGEEYGGNLFIVAIQIYILMEAIARYIYAFIVFITSIVVVLAFTETIFTLVSNMFTDTLVVALMQFGTFMVMIIFAFYIPYSIVTQKNE